MTVSLAWHSLLRAAALFCFCAVIVPTQATHAVALDVAVGGGPILAWDDPSNVGNGFGLYVQLHIDDMFAVGVGAATVLPDSRIQAQFGAFWVEGRVHPFGRDDLWTPYGLIGIGLATGDDATSSDVLPDASRWNPETTTFLGLVGVGVRLGKRTGLFATLDARAFNATQGGVHLSAGYAF